MNWVRIKILVLEAELSQVSTRLYIARMNTVNDKSKLIKELQSKETAMKNAIRRIGKIRLGITADFQTWGRVA
jgi:hypothetical protein